MTEVPRLRMLAKVSDGKLLTMKTDRVTTIWRKSEATTAQPELQPESLKPRRLGLLADQPLSKSALSGALGQKEISGHLNQLILVLLADQTLAYTIPDKPNSRLQQYRITEKGIALLVALRKGRAS